ncbi:MAG: protein kinase [Deltaproteobacteria bacterium]|jgi:serine/threonine protein kinase|nr:protein kinase [Deltaproteobacteria bacterium]
MSANLNPTLGTAYCPKCRVGYRLSPVNLGHRSICVKCGQNFHLLPMAQESPTRWLDTTAALNELATRVWEKGLDLRVGQVILGVYVVRDLLGRGGLGQVFRVRHRDWRKELALKLPYHSVMEPHYFQNLKNEAETWVGLGLHSHVVTCYYVRPLMGVPSIFMEYISGGSLKEALEPKGSTRSPTLFQGDETTRALRILDIAIQAGWGLEYAHSRGVLHLDVKPQNFLVEGETGRILVTDFGLARASKETKSPSDSASLWPGDQKNPLDKSQSPVNLAPAAPEPPVGFGTPQYMSPEAMEKRLPSQGFDLWALTLSILELFIGQRPWENGSAVGVGLDQFLAAVRPITSPSPRVMTFFRQALSADPSRRFQSAGELVTELQNIYGQIAGKNYDRMKPFAVPDSADNLNNQAVSMLDLGRPEEAENLWKEALRDEPNHVAAFFNLALFRFRHNQLTKELFRGQLSDLARLGAGRQIFDLPLMLCAGYLEMGLWPEAGQALQTYHGPVMNHEARRLGEILEKGRLGQGQIERSKPAMFHLSRIRERSDHELGAKMLGPLLTQTRDCSRLNDLPGALSHLKQARRLPGQNQAPEAVALWRGLYNRLRRVDLRDIWEEKGLTGQTTGELAAYDQGLLALANGHRLYFCRHFNTPMAVTTETKLASAPVALASREPGDLVATLTADGHLWLFDPKTGSGAGQTRAHNQAARALVFSPDGRRLFTAGAEGELKMWDTGHGYLDKGSPLLVRQISDRPLTALAISPNGRLLTILDGFMEYRLSAEKLNGPIRSLPLELNKGPGSLDFGGGPPFEITALVVDPFNRYLIAGHRGGISFHPLFDTDWQLDLQELAAPVTAAAISPDARLWAVAMADGRLLVGLAPNNTKGSFLPIRRLEAGGVHFLRFTSDNGSLLTVGQTGLALWSLDWNLDLPTNLNWDKKSEMILSNFLVRHSQEPNSEALAAALAEALASAGLLGLDGSVIKKRLSDAINKRLADN